MGKNVFEDLGFAKAEAAAMQARVTLAVEIENLVRTAVGIPLLPSGDAEPAAKGKAARE